MPDRRRTSISWKAVSSGTATTGVDVDHLNGSPTWHLDPNSDYWYRYVAAPSGEYSLPVTVHTANFRVLDGTILAFNPTTGGRNSDDPQKDDLPWGVNAAVVTGAFHPGIGNFPNGIDQAGLVWYADYAYRHSEPLMFDLETNDWNIDPRGGDAQLHQAEQNIENYIALFDELKARHPASADGTDRGLQIGIFGTLSGGLLSDLQTADDLWMGRPAGGPYQSQYDLLAHLDYLAPIGYTAANDLSTWYTGLLSLTNEAHRMASNYHDAQGRPMPVLTVLWPRYWLAGFDPNTGQSVAGEFLPNDLWQAEVAAVRHDPNSNGFVIWESDGADPRDPAGTTYTWQSPQESAWWNTVTSFVGKTATPNAPTVTRTSNDLGLGLTWSSVGNADAFLLDRSTSSTFSAGSTTSVLLPADTTSWDDRYSAGNTSYYYRLTALEGASASSYATPTDAGGHSLNPILGRLDAYAINSGAAADGVGIGYDNFTAFNGAVAEFDNVYFSSPDALRIQILYDITHSSTGTITVSAKQTGSTGNPAQIATIVVVPPATEDVFSTPQSAIIDPTANFHPTSTVGWNIYFTFNFSQSQPNAGFRNFQFLSGPPVPAIVTASWYNTPADNTALLTWQGLFNPDGSDVVIVYDATNDTQIGEPYRADALAVIIPLSRAVNHSLYLRAEDAHGGHLSARSATVTLFGNDPAVPRVLGFSRVSGAAGHEFTLSWDPSEFGPNDTIEVYEATNGQEYQFVAGGYPNGYPAQAGTWTFDLGSASTTYTFRLRGRHYDPASGTTTLSAYSSVISPAPVVYTPVLNGGYWNFTWDSSLFQGHDMIHIDCWDTSAAQWREIGIADISQGGISLSASLVTDSHPSFRFWVSGLYMGLYGGSAYTTVGPL